MRGGEKPRWSRQDIGMNMKTKTWILLGLLGPLVFTLTGCVAVVVAGAAAAGAGTYAYVKGDLKGTVEASVDQTWAATQSALKELGYLVVEQSKGVNDGELKARSPTDQKVTIKVKRQTETLTDLAIRVGTFGDEAVSRTVMERIQKHLPVPTRGTGAK